MKNFTRSLALMGLLSFFSLSVFSQIYFDDFEGYPIGEDILFLQPDFWQNPTGVDTFALINNAVSSSGTQSLGVGDIGIGSLNLGEKTDGEYTIQMNMMVPDNGFWSEFYFQLHREEFPQSFTPEDGPLFVFTDDGSAAINTETESYPFTHPIGEWFTMTYLVNLNTGELSVLVNGSPVGILNYAETGLDQLGSAFFINLEAGTTVYFDDLLFAEGISNFYLLKNKFLSDEDLDCNLLGSEEGKVGFSLNIQNSYTNITRTSNENGEIKTFLLPGEYTLTAEPLGSYWEICPFDPLITIDSLTDTLEMDFAVQPTLECPEMVVDIAVPIIRRCFSSSFYVNYCNYGTATLANATLEVTLDPFMEYESSTIPLASQNGDVLTFALGDVATGECGNFTLTFYLSCDADLGQEHCYSAIVLPEPNCGILPLWDDVEECQENIGSFDPNDKTAYPGGMGENHILPPNTEIKYRVRFQNTGTDTAFNVRIEDELPEHLDLNSIRLGAHSHPFDFKLEDNLATFLFRDIMLPDSNVNEPASHGFLNFFIQQKADLPLGTVIENEAAIFFDFNEPVITNVAWHTIDIPSSINENGTPLGFGISPNPIKKGEILNVNLSGNLNGHFEILNVSGKKVRQGDFVGSHFQVPTNALGSGIFILKINTKDGQAGSEKLIVMP